MLEQVVPGLGLLGDPPDAASNINIGEQLRKGCRAKGPTEVSMATDRMVGL